MTQDEATNLIACFLLGLIATLAFIPVVASLLIKPAHADDWKRPDLDGWYSDLRRPGDNLVPQGRLAPSTAAHRVW
jgi:hypothetical protein